MSAPFATALRDAMNTAEGPAVEDALYAYATKPAGSPEATISAKSWAEVLDPFHAAGVDDQFIPPIVRVDPAGAPVGKVNKGDVLIYSDFRTDRAKPLTAAFLGIPFGGQVGGLSDLAKNSVPEDVDLVTMTHYDDAFSAAMGDGGKLHEAFNPAEPLTDTYAEAIGKLGIDQLVCAETEKWRAISWFKDGRRNLGYEKDNEADLYRTDRHPTLPITIKVVQSRKVAAHVQAPQMRAKEITDMLLDGVRAGVTDIFANYANADMVGHAMTTLDDYPKVVEGIKVLDEELGRLVPEAVKAGYTVFITADHGNAEEMMAKGGKARPSHTTNKVPFIVLGLAEGESATLDQGLTIGDFAPTAMALRGLDMPSAWDRQSCLTGNLKPSKMRKIMRLVLDGYGVRDEIDYNAMADAAKEKGSALNMDRWMAGEDGALSARAEASGERCGYPAGEAGTTEFGHVLFDAGRTVRSDLTLIDYAIESGAFFKNPAMLFAINKVKANPEVSLHIMGVLSDGKVHSSLNHMAGLLRLCQEAGLKKEQCSIHVITDGRDVAGDSSPQFISWLEEEIAKLGGGAQINSVWGRGWGKDRDNRWKRIESAFRCLSEGTAGLFVKFE